jgi:hypothetical protein
VWLGIFVVIDILAVGLFWISKQIQTSAPEREVQSIAQRLQSISVEGDLLAKLVEEKKHTSVFVRIQTQKLDDLTKSLLHEAQEIQTDSVERTKELRLLGKLATELTVSLERLGVRDDQNPNLVALQNQFASLSSQLGQLGKP